MKKLYQIFLIFAISIFSCVCVSFADVPYYFNRSDYANYFVTARKPSSSADFVLLYYDEWTNLRDDLPLGDAYTDGSGVLNSVTGFVSEYFPFYWIGVDSLNPHSNTGLLSVEYIGLEEIEDNLFVPYVYGKPYASPGSSGVYGWAKYYLMAPGTSKFYAVSSSGSLRTSWFLFDLVNQFTSSVIFDSDYPDGRETIRYLIEAIGEGIVGMYGAINQTNEILLYIAQNMGSGGGGSGSVVPAINPQNAVYLSQSQVFYSPGFSEFTDIEFLHDIVLDCISGELVITWNFGTYIATPPNFYGIKHLDGIGYVVYCWNNFLGEGYLHQSQGGVTSIIHVPDQYVESNLLSQMITLETSMDGRLQNISTELVALDAEVAGLGVFLADIDLGINSLVASNTAIRLAVEAINGELTAPVLGTNGLLKRIIENINDIEALYVGVNSISDDLITEIDLNWVDNLDAFRDDIVYNLYLFEGVFSTPNVVYSRQDIEDYFEGWCMPDA